MTFATGKGSGDYNGFILTVTKHTEWAMSPIIVKGSIEPIG